jgi:hypothetical protein
VAGTDRSDASCSHTRRQTEFVGSIPASSVTSSFGVLNGTNGFIEPGAGPQIALPDLAGQLVTNAAVPLCSALLDGPWSWTPPRHFGARPFVSRLRADDLRTRSPYGPVQRH